MNSTSRIASFFVLCLLGTASVAEEDTAEEGTVEKTDKIIADTQAKVDELAERIDESEQAKEVSAGILQPIYALAEHLSFPAVHWIAFAVMATGVVAFALQLVLGKLVILAKAGFSITEILSDALGLVISTVGLVLTTQAATENSEFTQSPAAVLSASGVGLVIGFVFYWWGQSQEIQALRGRRSESAD